MVPGARAASLMMNHALTPPGQQKDTLIFGFCRRFMAGSDSSDSEGDKRVVRSAKDRRFEELTKSCDEIRVRCRMPRIFPTDSIVFRRVTLGQYLHG
jgi:hypothetical protein